VLAQTISPLAQSDNGISPELLNPVVLASDKEGMDVYTYTNANSWFPTQPQKKVVTPVNSYTLSIPKLKIENAIVQIGGVDLEHGLVHYGGPDCPESTEAPLFSDIPRYHNFSNLLITRQYFQLFRHSKPEMRYSLHMTA